MSMTVTMRTRKLRVRISLRARISECVRVVLNSDIYDLFANNGCETAFCLLQHNP